MELKVFGIDVVLIEPGAIASKFASNGAVLGTDEGSYMQLMRGIERLAAVVYKAAIMRRPKARYRPGIVAKALIQVRLWLPTRMWDYMFVSWLTRAGK
jgi:short-subunit dehydrogenase